MAQFNFISSIEKDRISPVKKYQVFEASVGAETVEVHIPLESASLFETAAFKNKPISIRSLKRLVDRFEGKIE